MACNVCRAEVVCPFLLVLYPNMATLFKKKVTKALFIYMKCCSRLLHPIHRSLFYTLLYI